VVVPAARSGYLETAHPERVLPAAARQGASVLLRVRVGEHVVAGTPLAWVWAASPEAAAPDPAVFGAVLADAVRIGFERTLEQDAAFGIRQLVDMACKALSPAVNDPYTAIQAVDHLTVLFAALAERPLGDLVVSAPNDSVTIVVRGPSFGMLLDGAVGLIRRYAASEPTVIHALLRLLLVALDATGEEPERWTAIETEARLLVADAERAVAQPPDLRIVHAEADRLRRALAERRRASPVSISPTPDTAHRTTSPPLPT
jgi:uncharacterized membrane protein